MRHARGRQVLAAVVALLLALAEPALVLAQGTCAIYKTYSAREDFTAADVNAIQTVLGQTNMEPSCIDGMGDSNAQFDDTLIPESGGTRTLSTQLYHDVANLRYVTAHVMGWSKWWRHYEDINIGHRALRMHSGTLTQFAHFFRGEAHLGSASTRFHLVSYSLDTYSIGEAHPESVLFMIHVGTVVRFGVGIGGDVHVGSTLAIHAAGTATHTAIFRPPSPGTGIYWPAVNHVAIATVAADGSASGEVARFHAGGIYLARSHVNGTTPPRNTLSASNLIKAWARVSSAGALLDGFGVASVTYGGSQSYTITLQNAMTSANYAVACSPVTTATTCTVGNITATGFVGTLSDQSGFSLIVIGAQ